MQSVGQGVAFFPAVSAAQEGREGLSLSGSESLGVVARGTFTLTGLRAPVHYSDNTTANVRSGVTAHLATGQEV